MINLFYVHLIIHSICLNMFGHVSIICIICLISLFCDCTSLCTTHYLIYVCLFLIRHCPSIFLCLHLIQCQILNNCVREFQYQCMHIKIVNVVVCIFFSSHWPHLSIICTHHYQYLKYNVFKSHAKESQRKKPSLN